MPQAVSIVDFNEGSKNAYTLNTAALESILGDEKLANKKVALISIAGAFRKGKSYILNFFIAYLETLLNGQKGEWLNSKTPLDKFHYKGGTQRDTNGILIWDEPYLFETPDGELAVFLMDTQGTFDHQSTVKDCTTIFALSTLISSVQIFNLSGQIQEDDLNNLRLFAEYAKLAGDQENQSQFQKLIFLIRDWPNSEEIEYGFEGGQEYLDDVLKVSSKQKKELQNVRKNLKSSFESLEAFLMPHPGLTIARNNSQKILGEKVEKDFMKQMKDFVPSLFYADQLEAKTINGKPITCGELLELLKAYMEIFNSEDLPEPETILEATAKAVLISAEQSAKKEFDDYMEKKMSDYSKLTNLEILVRNHKEAESIMMKKFEKRPMIGDDTLATSAKENLRKHSQKCFEGYKKMINENIRLEQKEKHLQEEKKKQLEEQAREKQRIKAEEERLRQEREAQERRRKEQEEMLRRQREEQERQRRAEEERIRLQEEQNRRRMQEQEESLRRERVEMERREQQRRQEEAERQRVEQQRREQEERRYQQQLEQQQRQYQQQLDQERERARQAEAAQERAQAIQLQKMMNSMNQGCHSPSYSISSNNWGGSSPSYSSGPTLRDGVRAETYTTSRGNECTRYRGANGRFVSKDNAFE